MSLSAAFQRLQQVAKTAPAYFEAVSVFQFSNIFG
jgi:hypothetical protein